MIGQYNAMQNYMVFKSDVEKKSNFNELPPNYHLKKARSSRSIELPQGFEPVDRYSPREDEYSVDYRKEEENILSLFRRLNDRLFGQKDSNQISRESAQAPEYKIIYQREEPRQSAQAQTNSTETRGKLLHPIFQNSWWNSMEVQEDKRPPVKREMTQRLEQWCQAEYEQTRVLDESFYTPQELRDRISVFKEINDKITSVEMKLEQKKHEQPEQSEPWDLAKPLPINPKGIGTYEAMDDQIEDDEESYRNMYYSSTFERVA